jgi:predicted nucleic acid-binding protein
MGMSRIFFDTNLFIYLLEDATGRGKRVADIIEQMPERADDFLTSTLTLGEVLVKPLSVGDQKLADLYEQALHSPGVELLAFDSRCARSYASLRHDRTIRAPDAIQLSCAAAAGCDLFITNDDRLSRKHIPGIHFVTSLDAAPF